MTSAGLHKKGVQLPGDDWWGQLVQGMFTLISWGAFQVQIATLFYSSITKKNSEMETTQHKKRDAIYPPPSSTVQGPFWA